MRTTVAIIGSGPAGVAAARPLIESGFDVLMLEAGSASPTAPISQDWTSFRLNQPDQMKTLFGSRVGLSSARPTRSPKFALDWFANRVAESPAELGIDLANFAGSQIAAIGGLSTSWGAGVTLFNEEDLQGWPISATDLTPHYRALASVVGLSGKWDASHGDAPKSVGNHPGLHPTAQRLLARFRKDATNRHGFSLNPALQAVLSQDSDSRLACDLSGNCLYGCHRGSIWSASQEVAQLKLLPGFSFRTNTFVDRLEPDASGGWILHAVSAGADTRTIIADHVVCAAGAIASPRLITSALGEQKREFQMLSTPSGAFPLVMPSRLGAPWENRVFGLSQLQFHKRLRTGSCFGNLFAIETLPRVFIQQLSPLSWGGTFDAFRELTPTVLVGNVFFDGSLSRHTINVRDGTAFVLGSNSDDLAATAQEAGREIQRFFGRLGAIMPTGRISLADPGSDLHFAATIPMRERPALGQCSSDGAVAGVANLLIVDGSALSTLPPKSHTFTIMANARRIASIWAKRWTR